METITLILLLISGIILIYLGYRLGSAVKEQEWSEKIPQIREESVKRSRSVLTGSFSEQLAPFMPGFPYSPTECRFIGKPIDFLVFKGMDSGNPEEVIFVEVKTGSSGLSQREKKLREIIKEKKVSWLEYNPGSKEKGEQNML